jgi:hypothetical protein
VNTPTREDLLGYILGALDADEQQQVEKCLQAFPELLLEIEQLKSRSDAIRSALPAASPTPAGLARRTCEQIARRSRAERAEPNPVEELAQSATTPAVSVPQSPRAEYPKRILQSMALVCCAAFLGALMSSQFQGTLTNTSSAMLVASTSQPRPTLRARPYISPPMDGLNIPATAPEILPITYTADAKPAAAEYSLFEISRQWQELNEVVADDLLADIKDYRSSQDLQHFSIDPLIESNAADYPLIQFVSQ